MDHHEAFEAVRLAFHSDVPDALLRRVIEQAIRNHQEETESQKDEVEAEQESKTAKGAGENG
jgi:hypothetical protein